MEQAYGSGGLPVLILIFLLLLAAIPAQAAGYGVVENVSTPRAPGDNGTVLYIYGSDIAEAQNWKTFLNGIGYHVDLLPVDGLMDARYSSYNLVIIGRDAYAMDVSDIKILSMSGAHIFGIGAGGARAYSILGYGLTDSTGLDSDTVAVSKRLCVFNYPNYIDGIPGNIKLYTTLSSVFYALTFSWIGTHLFPIGSVVSQEYRGTIVQTQNFLLYGYAQNISDLTPAGKSLLQNLVYYMRDRGYTRDVGRAWYRIEVDGTYNPGEWTGGESISLSPGYKDYVIVAQDEDNFYLLMVKDNDPSYNFDMIQAYFDRDNTKFEGINEYMFYITFSEGSGVKIRFGQSDGTWSDLQDPDGVNIEASWTYGTKNIAEVRISKSYLNLTGPTDNLLGFAVWVGNGSANLEFPDGMSTSVGSTYGTLYSRNHWMGQDENIPAILRDPVFVDGHYSSTEWYGASFMTYVIPGNYYFAIRASYDDEHLYLGGWMSNVSGSYSNIFLYFDPEGDGGTAPHTDDFEIWGGKSSLDNLYAYEHYGTGSGWGDTQNLTNASMKFSMDGSVVYFELSLNFNKLNITPGEYKEIRARIGVNIDGNVYSIPTYGEHSTPNTWNFTIYPLSNWSIDYTTHDAPSGSLVTLDGVIDGDEWSDSFSYNYYTNYGRVVYTHTKTNGSFLFIGIKYYYYSDSNDTRIDMAFDVGYDHSGAPGAEDFGIRITEWGYAAEYHYESGSWVQVSPSGWVVAMNNNSGIWQIEIRISYEKLGVQPGHKDEVGFTMFIVDASFGMHLMPQYSSFSNTTTWNRIVSSDYWGSSEPIPEVNPILSLLLLAVALGVLFRRK